MHIVACVSPVAKSDDKVIFRCSFLFCFFRCFYEFINCLLVDLRTGWSQPAEKSTACTVRLKWVRGGSPACPDSTSFFEANGSQLNIWSQMRGKSRVIDPRSSHVWFSSLFSHYLFTRVLRTPSALPDSAKGGKREELTEERQMRARM
jgi:hypothetical protein